MGMTWESGGKCDGMGQQSAAAAAAPVPARRQPIVSAMGASKDLRGFDHLSSNALQYYMRSLNFPISLIQYSCLVYVVCLLSISFYTAAAV